MTGTEAAFWNFIVGTLSVLISVLLSIWIIPRLNRKRQRKEAQEALLLRFLNSWLTPAHPEYQASLASIGIVFNGCVDVARERDRLIAFSSDENAPARYADRYEAEGHERKAELIVAMSNVIEIPMEKKQLIQGAYISRGFVEREVTIHEALKALPSIAKGIEQSTELTRELLSEIKGRSLG